MLDKQYHRLHEDVIALRDGFKKEHSDLIDLIHQEAIRLNEVDVIQWESVKVLYNLGRKNVIKISKQLAGLALLGIVVGTARLIVAIKGSQK